MDAVQLPLFSPVIRRDSSWTDIFGASIRDMTPTQRMTRWECVKSLCVTDDDREAIAMYEDTDACNADGDGPLCRHCRGGWCHLQGLPVGYNPVMRCLGMACMGVGYEPRKERA